MTFNEMLAEMLKMKEANPDDPVWDEPVWMAQDDILLTGISKEDVTDNCDGSCEHPQCIYTLDADAEVKYVDGHNTYPGYTDEGLHFAVILHDNS